MLTPNDITAEKIREGARLSGLKLTRHHYLEDEEGQATEFKPENGKCGCPITLFAVTVGFQPTVRPADTVNLSDDMRFVIDHEWRATLRDTLSMTRDQVLAFVEGVDGRIFLGMVMHRPWYERGQQIAAELAKEFV